MPRLEHVNLVVTAIEPTLTFLLTAFPEWRVRGEGRNEWEGMPRRWLHVGDDEVYLTLNEFHVDVAQQPERNRKRDLKSAAPGLAHIGFDVPSLDDVAARLNAAGYVAHNLGERHPHRRNIYYLDGEGLEFEFVEYLSDVPAEKNLYR